MKLLFEHKSILALKTWVIITWLLAWNLILGIAIFINGGLGPINNPTSAYTVALVLIFTSIFCFYLVYSCDFQKMMLHPTRKANYDSWPFILIGSITLILGAVFFINLFF